jgi:Glycosyltransferase family 87
VTSLKTKSISLWFVLGLCVSATAWLYVRQILRPWADAKDLQKGEIKAQMGDLYPRWVGARELLLNGRNPYGPEVTHEIQMAYYGHPVSPEGSERRVVDEQRFAYPIYIVFLIAPTIYTDFSKVYFWTPFVLGAFAGLSVLLSVRLLDWRLPWATEFALLSFALSSPQIIQGMRNQQLALVVACLLTAGAWLVHKGHLGTAGVTVALSTIKPQMALLPLLWFLLWATGKWRARWPLLLGFGGTITLLVGAGELLLPGWLEDFYNGIAAYRKYFPTTSLPRLLLGDSLGAAVSIAIIVWLLLFAWRNLGTDGGSRQFVRVFAAFLMGTVLAFPLFTPFNQALLILPALLVLKEWAAIPKIGRHVFVMLVFWPWLASMALLFLRPTLSPASQLPLLPALAAVAVPLILPLLLFLRWKSTDDQVQAGASA